MNHPTSFNTERPFPAGMNHRQRVYYQKIHLFSVKAVLSLGPALLSDPSALYRG